MGVFFKSFDLEFVPYLSGAILISCVSLTYLIARISGRKKYPYSLLCKCGARAPASYIFISGFCTTAALYIICIVFVGNHLRMSSSSAGFSAISIIADVLGVISMICMVLMSLVSVYEYELLHNRLVLCFTLSGIVYQWFTFGLALNSMSWAYFDYARLICVIFQTLFCLVMYICNYVENVLNGVTSFRNKEDFTPTAEAGNLSPLLMNTKDDQVVYYPEVNLSMKIWVVMQYINIVLCAWFFTTFSQFMSNYSIILQANKNS
jgi:hypothetical protein